MKMRFKIALALLALLIAAAAVVYGVIGIADARRLVILDNEQIASVLEANEYNDESSQVIAEAAVSIAGKVHYFWGGKSRCIGPDPNWGELRTVTSSGSSTTGTERPFGLDCSGYITWVYLQLGDESIIPKIGEGTWAQWQNSRPIEWEELTIGDLVFQNKYPGANANHVAVCIGYYHDKPVFAHCSSAQDNVVVTTAGSVFRYARRPQI